MPSVRAGAGFPDVLVLDHDTKFTSDVFRAFVKSMVSSLIVGSAKHKITNAKAERANSVISDTLRAYSNGCNLKDEWDLHLTLAEFAINNAASTLGDSLMPFFMDRGAHLRLSFRRHSRPRPLIAPLATRLHPTQSGCGGWRRQCGSFSLPPRQSRKRRSEA